VRQGCESEPIGIDLRDGDALDAARVGAKAAQLARASRAGLPIVPGVVLPCTTIDCLRRRAIDPPALDALVEALWHEWGREGSLIVRSSSTVEDTSSSSMAGVFTSVLDVTSAAGLREAIDVVAHSGPAALDAPMAVLIQPMLHPRFGGVAFAADPVTGETNRVVIAAVRGGPDRLVAGTTTGAHYTLGRHGRVRRRHDPIEGLVRRDLRRVARLARRASSVAGTAQDIEWAIDEHGRLLLLQSRPITTLSPPTARRGGRRYGTGPVAETFPAPLSRLEQELWLPPLEQAISAALDLVGARRPGAATRPTVVALGGRVAVDLERLGVRRRRGRSLLDPRVALRQLAAAWRVGRLRTVLPHLAAEQISVIDRDLSAVPALHELDERELLTVLEQCTRALVAVHGYEVLAVLLHDARTTTSLASVALAAAARGHREGIADDDLAAFYPETLALSAPRIGAPALAPPTVNALADRNETELSTREALRLRVRWIHELSARAAFELGARLTRRGSLLHAEHVRHVTIDELRAAVLHSTALSLALDRIEPGPELPTEFLLLPDGATVVAPAPRRTDGRRLPRRERATSTMAATRGLPASGGRAAGTVWDGHGVRPPAAVLVVRTLDPQLASALPHCVALVAETGNVLSHLAILAREFHVPAVVACANAVETFPAGATVVVDGDRGRVALADHVPADAPAEARP
jgi:pyruvate,water dikinase